MKMRQRGVSTSTQAALIFPLAIMVLLITFQWGLNYWAQATAMTAAQQGAQEAAAKDATMRSGEAAARRAVANGSLREIAVKVQREGRYTRVTVSGVGMRLLWSQRISKTVVVPTERIT